MSSLSDFPWSPPEGPERPVLPYACALTVTITEHIPPQPSGLPIKPPCDTSDEHPKTLTQTEVTVTSPPLEANLDNDTDGAAPREPTKATLILDRPIVMKDGWGPQVVLCTVTPQDGHGKPFQAVAKIFDPLYYSSENQNPPEQPVATALEADSDYSTEAAAYVRRQKTGQMGAFAPKYYGSWTLSLPIGHCGVQHERRIRLLLVEYIDGVCMRNEGHKVPFKVPHTTWTPVEELVRLMHKGLNRAPPGPPGAPGQPIQWRPFK
ncbi:uncharacterized protein B0H64DRAFT_389285 [Chaetomium fimeti]|uniref:Uncharacterized protein n=1 Tax=Chaetomium fimeti TaxID=1854472 RepID=A0AAE0LW26_9PEZI|nr:hypothetical protein B0H64DRAFT_389285 [Chaetomium fimeti]